MKKLVVIVFCLFSIFVVCTTTVQAYTCSANMPAKELKKCDGFSDGTERYIYDDLLLADKVLFFITCVLCVLGIKLGIEKKEVTEEEKFKITLFCWSPLIPIVFLMIIKVFENLM